MRQSATDLKSFVTKLIVQFAMLMAATQLCSAQQREVFVGNLDLRALPDGRTMKLLEPFSYVDSNGTSWSVPVGTIVDGASIPGAFWSIIGAPFTGKYREASVIHDYYCQTRSRHWKAVHRVFYDGMNARGVEPVQAKLMYLAVYRFGSRWDFDVDACFCKGCPLCDTPDLKRVRQYNSKFNKVDYQELETRLRNGGTVEELEELADYQLNSEIVRRTP